MRVVITGASRGLGKEFVRQCLQAGHEVHAVTRHPEGLTDLAGPARLLTTHNLDLEAKDGPAALARALEERPVDLLINNAGAYLDDEREFTALTFEEIRESFEVNTILPMRVTQALLPNLLAATKLGNTIPPRLVQITSLMGSIGDNSSGSSYGYRMSKAALNMFTRSFAIDYPSLCAVALHPGWVKTEMGGKEAPTTSQESIAGMMKVMNALKPEQSGKFYDYTGEELPW